LFSFEFQSPRRFILSGNQKDAPMKNIAVTSISGPNPLCPERMSSEARLAEIGRILAAGVIRLNAAQSSGLSPDNGDSFVDFSPRKSGARRAKRLPLGGIDEVSQ
jgi:hypothetical protein